LSLSAPKAASGGGYLGGGGGGGISGGGGGADGYGGGGGGSYTFAGTPFSLAYRSGNGAVSINAVPEPSTWVMAFAGFAGLGWHARMRRRKLMPA
jgi:PEP-CTERM motif